MANLLYDRHLSTIDSQKETKGCPKKNKHKTVHRCVISTKVNKGKQRQAKL